MFNNLGFWAAGAGVQTFDFDLIATGFGSGTATDIVFESIPQAYKHLQIRYVAKSSSTATTLRLQFNNTGGTAYDYKTEFTNGSTFTSSAQVTNAAGIVLTYGVAPSTVSGQISGGIVDIFNYTDTDRNKNVMTTAGYFSEATVRHLEMNGGRFKDNAALSTIAINTGGANFLDTSSRFALYGIKG
jgi:hypothetical protein